jgi:Domain of unknown function (DUF4340)
MRSLGFTFLLLLLASAVCGVAVWQWKGGDFEDLLGAPPTPVGGRIYDGFTRPEVKHIRISQGGVVAGFDLTEKGWQATAPWKDRMDPRAAVGIIDFTLAMRVEDLADRDDIDSQKAGLGESGTEIRLEGADHQPLARYKLGRRTPWLATIKDMADPVATVFVLPRDENHKSHIYACTGDINPLFKDGLKYLRDHRPFYFNPLAVRSIRIRSEQGEVTLNRETPESQWRIVKPGDFPTDRQAIVSLLEGLYELQAVKVSDRTAVTLPATTPAARSGLIAIASFGSETETVLEIQPPDPPDARDVRATVSDRPDTVFDLPQKPEPDLVSLASLPLAVNDLRDPKLTNIRKENVELLRRIVIQPATGPEIVLSRTPPQRWMVTIDGVTQEANEERLYTLLKMAVEDRAIGFESDAATDFTPWGLDKPVLKLTFATEDAAQDIQLAFGISSKGGCYVNRVGTPTVMEVDRPLVDAIPRRTYEWRQSRLWSIDRLNRLIIGRKRGDEPPLNLHYNFSTEEWTANSNRQDLSPALIPARANYLLETIEGLKATRWLSPDDESAAKALLKPALIFKVIEDQTDELGDATGRITRDLLLAPGSAVADPAFYYGRLGGDPQPFLLDRDTYQKLASDLLED